MVSGKQKRTREKGRTWRLSHSLHQNFRYPSSELKGEKTPSYQIPPLVSYIWLRQEPWYAQAHQRKWQR
jgi:hypothetical protein